MLNNGCNSQCYIQFTISKYCMTICTTYSPLVQLNMKSNQRYLEPLYCRASGIARCFGGAGRFEVVAHLGMWRAAVSGANRLVQYLQNT